MLPVSTAFSMAAKAGIRKVRAKVEVTWTDPFIEKSIEIETTDNNRASFPVQVCNLQHEVHYKYISFDEIVALDGSFHPAPGTEDEAYNYELGWRGNTVSGVDGGFSEPYPQIKISFTARPILALLVVGDNQYNEYPVDFSIIVKKAGIALHTYVVTGNNALKWILDISNDNITEADEMILTITKWNSPGKVVKITEFYTSIIETYEGDDIISLNLLEEMELSDGSLPIGNISSNELDLKLQNSHNKYFPSNTASIFHTLVKPNRRIRAWLGFVLADSTTEWVPMGVFWSNDWDAPETEIYVSTSCYDRLALLKKINYTTGRLHENKTVWYLLKTVLEAARDQMPDLKYNLDPTLDSIVIPWAYFEQKNFFETIRDLITACMGRAYCDRNGILQIVGPVTVEQRAETVTPYEIDSDNYFTKLQPANIDALKNRIEINTKPLVIQPIPTEGKEEIYRSQEPLFIKAGESMQVICKYSSYPNTNEESSVIKPEDVEGEDPYPDITGSVISALYYAWGAVLTIKNNAAIDGYLIVVIKGQPLKVQGQEVVIKEDSESIRENGILTYKFPENVLIQSRVQASDIAFQLLASYAITRKDIEIDWRGNPALELTDAVSIPEYQKNGLDIWGLFYITRQSFSFDGALRAKLSARKVLRIDDYQNTTNAESVWQDDYDADEQWVIEPASGDSLVDASGKKRVKLYQIENTRAYLREHLSPGQWGWETDYHCIGVKDLLGAYYSIGSSEGGIIGMRTPNFEFREEGRSLNLYYQESAGSWVNTGYGFSV